MTSQNATLNDVRTILAQKRSEKATLETKLSNLAEDIGAIERVLSMVPNGTMDSKALSPTVQMTTSELRTKRTQKDALDSIADKDGGRIKVGIAKQLLIEAGFVKGNPKNVYGHIYNLLKNDNRYEPVRKGTGEFRKRQGSLPLQG